jgi:hypothetical protein
MKILNLRLYKSFITFALGRSPRTGVDGHPDDSDDFTVYENVDNDVDNATSISMSTSRRRNETSVTSTALSTTPKCLNNRAQCYKTFLAVIY